MWGPGRGREGRGPGASPAQRLPPQYVPENPIPTLSLTPVHGAQYCLGARCVTAGAGTLCPPGGQKGVIPAPILRKGWGRARGPAGVKASRKEALVRHRTGWWGGSSIMSLPPHPQGQESSLGGWGRQGKEAVPIPGAFLVPPGVDWAPSTRGIPKPPTTQLPKAPPPVPGHYCFAAPVGEGPDRPCQAALSPTAPGHCPQGVVSHEVSHRKAASDRGSGAGTGWLQASGQKSGYNPQLHVAPYTGACVD